MQENDLRVASGATDGEARRRRGEHGVAAAVAAVGDGRLPASL